MSRGPGTVQRLILESLAALPPGRGVCVTGPENTRAEQASLRRAAHRLAELGLIRLELRRVDAGRRRLTAWRPT